jgi:hypothetical protein
LRRKRILILLAALSIVDFFEGAAQTFIKRSRRHTTKRAAPFGTGVGRRKDASTDVSVNVRRLDTRLRARSFASLRMTQKGEREKKKAVLSREFGIWTLTRREERGGLSLTGRGY